MGLGLGLGIWWPIQTSIIPGILRPLKARATYFENVRCTTATLQKIENIQYTAPAAPVGFLASYPGASAAYSLRNLIDTTTNVVRVRRSSDNTEQDFSATQITDGTLLTFTGSGDGLVAIWYDQSGNSFNANQTTATNQPQIVSGGALITQNGKPSVYTPGFKNLNTGLVSIGTSGDISLDFFAVLKNMSQGNSRHLLGLSNNTTPQDRSRVLFLSNDSSNTKSVRLFGGRIIYDNSRIAPLLFNTNYQGGGGAFGGRINGADLSVNSFDNPGLDIDSLSGFMLLAGDSGGGDPTLSSTTSSAQGYVQEAIFYLNDQASNRTGIETNINNEYAIYPTSGLLKDYPDASAAYSLRNLANNTTNVVRVRRSSDNTEQNFTATQITDGTLTAFTGANDGYVTIWYDQSGNSNNASQTAAANQPKLVSSGVVELDNGKPCLNYDNTGNDNFDLAINLNNVRSVFQVWNAEQNFGANTQFILGSTNQYDYHSSAGSSDNFILGSSASGFVKGGANYINSVAKNFLEFPKPLTQCLVSMISLQSDGRVNKLTKDRYISGRSWRGKMQEIILYSTDQSSNRTGIETNINNEYTIY